MYVHKRRSKEAEKEWVDVFNKIVDNCIDHLVDNREEIELFELQRSDLTKAKRWIESNVLEKGNSQR